MAEILKSVGGGNFIVKAVDFRMDKPSALLDLGVSKTAIANRAGRGQTWAIGQLFGVAATGMMFAEHVFRGLRRPMSVNGNTQADEEKYIYTWTPNRDAQMTREGELKFVGAPLDRVFFVIVSPNQSPERYPNIFGWLEQWGWLESDEDVSGAPIDYATRYDSRVWSK